jgi:thiol:disulfide interchange protein
MLFEIFLLAVGSMFWPALLAVDVVAFKAPKPVRILGGFLAGGLVTTVAVGCAIVFSLESTSLVTRSRHTTDAAVAIALGVAALVAAFFIRRGDQRRRAAEQEPPVPHTSARVERLGAHGVALAFVTGVVLNVFPGVLPFIALKDIGELDYSTTGTIAVIVGFYVVMFTPVEAPLVAFLVAPQRTAQAVDAFNVWLAGNLRKLAWLALAAFGAYEIVRGALVALHHG